MNKKPLGQLRLTEDETQVIKNVKSDDFDQESIETLTRIRKNIATARGIMARNKGYNKNADI